MNSRSEQVARIDSFIAAYGDDSIDPTHCVTQMIADAIHWCDAHDIYFDELHDEAQAYYLNDLGEDA